MTILYNGKRCVEPAVPSPLKLPLPMGDPDPHLVHGSLGWAHPSPQLKWHLDRFSYFCRVH